MAMKPLLALSFGLLLGQTPQATPALPSDADIQDPAAIALREAWEQALEEASLTTEIALSPPVTLTSPADAPPQTAPVSNEGTGGAGLGTSEEGADTQTAAPATTAPEAPPATLEQMGEEVQRLQAQVQSLQTQLQTQQQESASVAQGMEQELSGMRERALELERLRTENLALLERAATFLAAADQALSTGELAVDSVLEEADTTLAAALQNASASGRGNAALQVEAARSAIAQALDATGRRDIYYARWALLDAVVQLRAASSNTLDRQDSSVLNP
ncbi:hypothetical protein POL68_39960 [Stigmatella sp. ncwal1]|uniref:Uncharacterized protein n=1 Tax=Stigmatella ashevillensis TaxID=2995309 RepID=A0ABT5DPM8_9BACT|nr:hypothetical protein [Stigmatella ashevillena]MDC0714693.1 hypothetical protein [Stigmatella ashevillena]